MTDFETTQTITSRSDDVTNSTSATSLSDADYATSEDSTTSPYPNKYSIKHLVPTFVRDLCRRPKSIELRVNFDAPTFQTIYAYSITWDDVIDSDRKYKGILEQKMSSSSLNVLSTSTTVGGAPVPVDGECDGPCKRVYPSNLLNTIGRCGHYLCNACYGIVRNADGTNGCSSLHCYWKGSSREETNRNYEKEVCRKQRARAREMKKRGIDVKSASLSPLSHTDDETSEKSVAAGYTTCSVTSACDASTPCPRDETCLVNLVIVQHAEGNSMKQIFTHTKAPLSAKIQTVIEHLLSQNPALSLNPFQCGTLYFTELKADKTRRMRRVKERGFEKVELIEMPQISGTVTFVLDLGGFVEKGHAIYLK